MQHSSQAKPSPVRLALDCPPSSLTRVRCSSHPRKADKVLVVLQLQSSALPERRGQTRLQDRRIRLGLDRALLSRTRERAPCLHTGRSTWHAPQRALIERGGNSYSNRTAGWPAAGTHPRSTAPRIVTQPCTRLRTVY